MRTLWRVGLISLVLCLVGACALPASQLAPVAPADSTGHGGAESFLSLAIIAAFVLVVIPAAAKPWR